MGLREALRRRSRPQPGEPDYASVEDAPPAHRHAADARTGQLVRNEPVQHAPAPHVVSATHAAPTTDAAPVSPVPVDDPPPTVNGAEAHDHPGFTVQPWAYGRASGDEQNGRAKRPTPRGPSKAERALVQQAWDAVGDRADEFVRMFYAELFLALGDEALRMFPSDMAGQRHDFGKALVQWVVADDPDTLSTHLEQLGDDHRKFDVEPQHYDIAATALLSTWRRMAGSAWTDEVESAVITSYTRLAAIMTAGADSRRDQPASWGATVLAHERKDRDFAVLRIQPDAPYSFRPGQYLTLELASQPRRWRQMSFASAPRPDNTFDIHVRAVAATGVSGALVAHTAVGDRLRLGPPRGSDLVIDASSEDAGLLAICSGTGAAPITAVVEAMAARQDCPPVYVFVGGRVGADLHPVAELQRIVDEHGRQEQIRVYGVAAEDAQYPGFHAEIEEFVPRLQPWAKLGIDVLVAGPETMTAATVSALRANGVPPGRIHFDQYVVPA